MNASDKVHVRGGKLSWLLRWLTPLWVALSLTAIAWQVAVHWREIVEEPVRPNILFVSLLATVVAKFSAALQVRRSLLQANTYVDERSCFYVYSMGDLAKYLPGGIWGFVSRIALYRKLRLDVGTITRALIIEQIWLVGGATSIGMLLLGIGLADSRLGLVSIGILVAWAVFLSFFCGSKPAFASRSRGAIVPAAIQIVLWGMAGLGFGLLLPDKLLAASGAFCVAFAAGLIVPFAPSGLGVREAVIASLLSSTLPIADILRALLLSRIVWIAADTIFAVSVVVTCRGAWIETVRRRAGNHS